jgi:hypothetical protein
VVVVVDGAYHVDVLLDLSSHIATSVLLLNIMLCRVSSELISYLYLLLVFKILLLVTVSISFFSILLFACSYLQFPILSSQYLGWFELHLEHICALQPSYHSTIWHLHLNPPHMIHLLFSSLCSFNKLVDVLSLWFIEFELTIVVG